MEQISYQLLYRGENVTISYYDADPDNEYEYTELEIKLRIVE